MRKIFRWLAILLIVGLVLPNSLNVVVADAEVMDVQYDKTALEEEIKELYASAPGSVGRLRKMQAFIMEIALHAKSINPDFKVIPQDGINLAFEDGDWTKGEKKSLISLVDGWGIEGMVGNGALGSPSETQQKYIRLTELGLMVTDTTTCSTDAQLANYHARANAWGIIPFPRFGGTLSYETLFPGWRWATNQGNYFWVEDPVKLGVTGRINDKDIYDLADAKTYLYNINSKPYDNWFDWDAEEITNPDGSRTRITASNACGLLVPSAGGPYKPAAATGNNATITANAIATYGDEWDWWWRKEGLDVNAGRETWLNALRASNFDVIYIDSFYNHKARPENQTPLTKEEVESLKYKANGGRRQVIAYLSVGSAEQNRWFCQDDWIWNDPTNPESTWSMKAGKVISGVYSPPEDAPAWLAVGYGGNFDEEATVAWWHPEWRDIIINGGGKYAHKTTGDNTSSIDRIIAQGFDGVYLDNVGQYSKGSFTQFETYWLAEDIASAKAAVNGATYIVPQAKAGTEEDALEQINEILETLNLNGMLGSISADVGKVSYTGAVAGTSDEQDGTDGSYVFTVTLDNGFGTKVVTEELALTITATPFSESFVDVESVKIDGAAIQQVRMRNTKQFTATVNPANATDQSVTWESSNTKIFTVDDNGLVTGLGTGSAKLIVTCGGKTSFIMVQITA